MRKYSKGQGWFKESRRHSLASKGIKTGRKSYASEPMGDVWKLETPQEDIVSDQLSVISERAMKGDRKSQNFLRKLWDNEKWSSIKNKLQTEGSVWYVWWMDGVRNLMNKQNYTRELQFARLSGGQVHSKGIDLKDPTKYKFGSVAWQDVMLSNILEKRRHNEELSPIEKTFLELQEEHLNRINYQQDVTYAPTQVSVLPPEPTLTGLVGTGIKKAGVGIATGVKAIPQIITQAPSQVGADIRQIPVKAKELAHGLDVGVGRKVIQAGQAIKRQATPEAGWVARGIQKEKELGKKVVKGAGKAVKGFFGTVAEGLASDEAPYIRPRRSIYSESVIPFTNNPVQPVPPPDKAPHVGFARRIKVITREERDRNKKLDLVVKDLVSLTKDLKKLKVKK